VATPGRTLTDAGDRPAGTLDEHQREQQLPVPAVLERGSRSRFHRAGQKSMQYDRREHQKTDVAAKIKGQSGAEHQQHQPQQRLSLFPPADGQTSPKRYQYAGCHRTKDLAKVQNAFADILNRASWKRCLLTSDF